MSCENNTVNRNIGYREVFQQKEFMKSVLATVINRFGDSIDSIAFTWLVFTITNSAAWTTIIFGVNFLPTIFIQPFAGALVENINKKRIMIATDIIRGICVSIVAIMFIFNLLNPWILLGITLIISSAEAFRNPANTAILPNILEKESYEFGMSLNSLLSRVVEVIGLASAGSIIALFGTQTAIFIDAITFFGSAIIIFSINTKEEQKKKSKIHMKEYMNTLKSGFYYIKKKQIILNFILLAMFANGILVPLNSLQAPLVKNVLKQSEYMLSVISLSMVLGMGLGSLLYPYITQRIKSRIIVFIGGLSISIYYFLLILCGNLSEHVILIYILCALFTFTTGIGVSLLISVLQVQFVKQVEKEYLARAGAILSAGCVMATPVVAFVISILTKLLTLINIFYVVGGMGILFFIFVYIKKVEFE